MNYFVVIFSLNVAASCLPAKSGPFLSIRPKRQHGMAFSGFYMTKTDTDQKINQEPLTFEEVKFDVPLANIDSSTEINEVIPHTSQETITEKSKTKPPKYEQDTSIEDNKDDDDDTWPFMMTKNTISKGRFPSMSFFPIMFGATSGRSGGLPDGSIAIANSFSTARKGMAVSNAFAGGVPDDLKRKSTIGAQQD